RTSTRWSSGCRSSSSCWAERCGRSRRPGADNHDDATRRRDDATTRREEPTMADAEPGAAPVRQQRFQRRMSDAEALMWNVEKDPWLNPSGGSFSILDRMPDVDHLRAQLAAAVVTVPRLMEHV